MHEIFGKIKIQENDESIKQHYSAMPILLDKKQEIEDAEFLDIK